MDAINRLEANEAMEGGIECMKSISGDVAKEAEYKVEPEEGIQRWRENGKRNCITSSNIQYGMQSK